MGIDIVGTGVDLGRILLENSTIEELAGLQPGSILEKTGISQRRIVDQWQSTRDLASNALNSALLDANLEIASLDHLVVATFAHDKVFPSLASRLLSPQSWSRTQALDIQSNCTGFLNGISIVHDRLLNDVDATTGAVVASEVNSRFVDLADSSTSSFFGDGAGAVVLKKTSENSGIVSRCFFSDTRNIETVELGRLENESGQINESCSPSKIRQMGIGTWRQAVTNLPRAVNEVLSKADLQVKDVSYFVFHQANPKLLHYLFTKLRIPLERTIVNSDRIGNTGAASLPIAFHEARLRDNALAKGSLVMFASIGAGFNFSAILWRL